VATSGFREIFTILWVRGRNRPFDDRIDQCKSLSPLLTLSFSSTNRSSDSVCRIVVASSVSVRACCYNIFGWTAISPRSVRVLPALKPAWSNRTESGSGPNIYCYNIYVGYHILLCIQPIQSILHFNFPSNLNKKELSTGTMETSIRRAEAAYWSRQGTG